MARIEVSGFKVFTGANLHLDRPAVRFTLRVDPRVRRADRIREAVQAALPALAQGAPAELPELFARALMEVLRMDINLCIRNYALEPGDPESFIAVESLDEGVTVDAAETVADWFNALEEARPFDFAAEFTRLQQKFDKTLLGGPTLYSLYEGAVKRGIPVQYLKAENQFQWGYGVKQIRGRSTTVSVDSIKDTEFTMYKDMVAEFLEARGFPTPKGRTFFREEEVVAEAERLGWPVVVKPVAGHKGQGVTTNIRSEAEVRKAFRVALENIEEGGFDGVIVQQQIEGTDHRLLTVKGRFVAALQRIPAYVEGDGRHTIGELIKIENDTPARLDNARSPLCKIKVDDDLVDYLDKQGLAVNSVPGKGQRVTLRRVANISAGGVSINVTEKVHPDNIRLVEDIASNFNVTCMGIDVLARDIARPWTAGDFGIIEINAGPGVFMHLAPALGGSVDVPGAIWAAHFPAPRAERIPLIAGHNLSRKLCNALTARARELKPGLFTGSLTKEGVAFDGRVICNNPRHDENVRILLRHPRLGFAVLSHPAEALRAYGMVHQGADVVVLDGPDAAEAVLQRDLLDDGHLVTVEKGKVTVRRKGAAARNYPFTGAAGKEAALLKALEGLLPGLVGKYD
jgi:cyanophycin synthetase